MSFNFNTSPFPAFLVSMLGAAGIVTHKNVNYNPALASRMKQPLVIGIVSLLLTRTSLVTESPRLLTNIMSTAPARIFLILCVSFLASPDVENAIFLSLLFLGILQLLRTKEERKRHPYML
jgi:hypothetical protein